MEPRILSIQSHVVSGYVGNKSAIFPMQLLGFDVDYVNSVQYSNHTGYEHISGQVITEAELAELITGLQKNGIDKYTHLLTGYVGSPGFLKQIATVYKQLKKANPQLIYVCDPVMGDNGSMYVPRELLPVYRDMIVPIASILLPNLYEAELLTDSKIDSEPAIWRATELLHSRGVDTVCISSAELPQCVDKICVFASTIKDPQMKLKMEIPKIPSNFTGSGDLFSALMLCFMYQSNSNLKESVEKAVAALQAVLRRTYEYVSENGLTPRNTELRLIQSRDDILHPTVEFRATIVQQNSLD